MTDEENPGLFKLPETGGVQLPEFEECSINEIPLEVGEKIKQEMAVHEVANSQAVGLPQRMNFGDGGAVYALGYIVTTGERGIPEEEKTVYAVDVNSEGTVAGYGISTMNIEKPGDSPPQPFVRYTKTETGFLKMGLGLRRLLVLNQANKLFYGKKLESGQFLDPGPERLWERLYNKGLTSKDEHGSYQFIK